MARPATKTEDLARLLARRVAASGQPPQGEVSVAELRRRLLPYEVARADLALATKAEYDLALLELLASEEYLESEDRELIEDARGELDSPEPGLAFLQDYAASHLRLRLEGLAEESADSPAARRATAAGGTPPAPSGGAESADEASPPDGTAGSPACWSCDRTLPAGAADARYCVWCGADQSVRPCGECGEELQVEWRFCPACGREAGA